MATGCGYSYREIDDMTMDEANEIFSYWGHSPPTYHLVYTIAQMLGWKPSRKSLLAEGEDGLSLEDIIASVPPEVTVLRGARATMPEIPDEEALRERNRQRMIEIARRNAASPRQAGAAA